MPDQHLSIMATQTITATSTDTSEATFKTTGKTADLNTHADLSKFSQPVTQAEYDRAVALIQTKLDSMSLVDALFSLNLGPDHPELIIDARVFPATLTTRLSTPSDQLDGQVYIRPMMIKRFIDGLMEPRYALRWGHIFMLSGPTRIGIKFVDSLCPWNVRHPFLSRLNISALPKPTTDIAQVKSDIEKWGYGLVANALTPSETTRLRNRLMSQAKGEADYGLGFFDGGELKPNQRIWCLPNKGQEFIDLLETNKSISDFVPDFLGDDAILFSYTANIARPGNTPMHLHTDQITIQPPIRSVAFGLNLMYFLEDVTPQNGGTLVMPGSHEGDWAPDDPYSTIDTVAAEGPAGTCMVFESRLWHATGANTVPGSERPVILVFFMRACMRQQENFQLSVADEVVERCSDKVKGYMGWRTTGSLGGVQGNLFRDGTIVRRPEKSEIVGVLGGESRGLHE